MGGQTPKIGSLMVIELQIFDAEGNENFEIIDIISKIVILPLGTGLQVDSLFPEKVCRISEEGC